MLLRYRDRGCIIAVFGCVSAAELNVVASETPTQQRLE
jgi:hypothetical protein